MKKAILFLSILVLYLGGSAQNPGWAMPDNYLKFQNGTVTQTPLPSPAFAYGNTSLPNIPGNGNFGYDGYDAGILPDYASNMMMDRNGDVRFFIVDSFIYDGEGNLIEKLTIDAFPFEAQGYQEIGIVPDPGNCDRYYIISHSVVSQNRVPYIFLLDMSLQNERAVALGSCDHYGALVPIGPNGSFGLPVSSITPNWVSWSTFAAEFPLAGIAISDLRDDNSYFVYISAYLNVYKYKVDATGFNATSSTISLPHFHYKQSNIRSEMELVSTENGTYRIAINYKSAEISGGGIPVEGLLLLAELDSNGDIIEPSRRYFPTFRYLNPAEQNFEWARFKGLEFSSNGRRLYATRIANGLQPFQLSYFDYDNPTTTLQPIAVPSSYDVSFSQIELGPNDELYLPHANGMLKMPNATIGVPGPVASSMTFPYALTNLGYSTAPGANIDSRLYNLPDQIDGMDYEAYNLATQQCCINSGEYEAEKYVANSGIWTPNNNPFLSIPGSDVYIKDELRIPADANVTIDHMNFHFAPGARVVIENGTGGQQGGKLTLNNTTFTVDNRCGNDLWMGVEVWGNTNELQGNINNSSQGRLVLQNNAEISHAFIGALASKRRSTFTTAEPCPPIETVNLFSFESTNNGGIIQANNANFRANQRGVFFMPYLAYNNANNLSYFNQCQFVWDAPLYGSYSLQHQAHLSGVKGIRFVGSNFENQDASSFPYTSSGSGIYAYNSQFHVQESCPTILAPCTACSNPTPSTFLHLRYGIRTNNPSNPLTYTVNRSVFEDCQFGIYSQFTNNSSITENLFDIRQAEYQTAGIVMNRTPIYTIQENDFVGIGDPAGQLSYGIVVNNTGTYNNDIYKNEFEKLHIAVQSEGNNAVEITPSNYPGSTNFNMAGLNYTCNNYTAAIDLADMTIVDGRIDFFQGHAIGHPNMNAATLGSARNYFSLNGEPMALGHDITVSGPALQELQYVGLNTPHYFIDSYTQNWVLPLISSYNGVPAEATTGMCPSLLCEKDQEALVMKRANLLSSLNGLNNEMQNLDPRDDAGRRVLQSQIHAVQEEIDLVEAKIINLILLEEEDLAVIQAGLLEINRRDIYDELALLVSQNIVFAPVPAVEVDEFLPILPAGSGRKVAASTVQQEKAFSISPNPSKGNLNINFEEKVDAQIELSVLDLMGKIVYQGQRNAQQTIALDLNDLNSGVYFVLVKSEGRLLGSKKIEILK